MKTPHEWPQHPSALKSSSSRRKLTRDALASVDWHKPPRYNSYSDGDDDRLHTRELLDAACQSSAYGEGMEIPSSGFAGDSKDVQSSDYGKGKEIHIPEESVYNGEILELQTSGYQDHKGLKSVGYGTDKVSSVYDDVKAFVVPSSTPKMMSSFDREGKPSFPANRRVNHAGKPQSVRLSNAALVAIKESGGFDTKDPVSPEVTCLGRVKIKEKNSHHAEHLHFGCVRIKDTEQTHTEQKTSGTRARQALEKRKQSVGESGKDEPQKGSSKREVTEKTSCLRMRKRREDMDPGILRVFRTPSTTAVPLEMAAETRRERAAILARSVTSLLEDLRRLDMENSGYVPVVPPSNSLLLMRGFANSKNSSTLLNGSAESPANGILPHDINTQRGMPLTQTSTEKWNASAAPANVPKVSPLTDIESNVLVQRASPSNSTMDDKRLAMDNSYRPHELALWQRRAIAQLDALDTKRPMRMEMAEPRTK